MFAFLKKNIKSAWLIAMLIALFLGVATPVFAVDDPDYISIGDVYVFRDLLEDDDQLFFMRYDVSYNTTPSEDADETFQMAIYDTDETTILWNRPLNYYQHNVISIYLSADDALTWNEAYVIRVEGMPSVFSPLTEDTNRQTLTVSSSNYKERADMDDILLAQAEILEADADWDGVTLVSAGYLTTTGTYYFTQAIPNLGTIAPDILVYSMSYPTPTNTTWNTSYIDTLESHQGTKLQGAIQNIADTFGLDEGMTGVWLVSMLYLVTAGVIYAATRDPGVSILCAFPVYPVAAWLGIGGGTIMMLVISGFAIAGIMFAVHFFLARFA